MFPYLTAQAPWFAFLVHPRDSGDLLRTGLGEVLHAHSVSEAEFVSKACSLPPLVVGEIRFGFAPIRGELVSSICLPEDVLTVAGQRAVVRSAQLAVTRGARVLGLGGLTAPATGGGRLLLRHLPFGVTLTNGNAFTAAVVRSNVLEAAAVCASDRACRVAVIGCTGSVGVAACHLLADTDLDLLFIGRNEERARSLLGPLQGRAAFSGELAAARDADVIVLLTNDASAECSPALFSPGAIVIDVAQPPGIPAEVRCQCRARGVDVVDGGLVRIRDYTCTYDLKTPQLGDTYACLAETYLFACEGLRDHSVGRPTAELALHLERVAPRHGVTRKPLDFHLPREPGHDATLDRATAAC